MAAEPVGEADGVGGGEGIVEATGGGTDSARGGAVHVSDEDDGAVGSDGMPEAMNDPDPSATALTFSIRNSYRHPSAGLEEFLTSPTNTPLLFQPAGLRQFVRIQLRQPQPDPQRRTGGRRGIPQPNRYHLVRALRSSHSADLRVTLRLTGRRKPRIGARLTARSFSKGR